MKKALLLTALALTIVASMVSGTLAVYSQDLDPYDTDIVAKEFILVSEGDESFDADVLIAPTETVTIAFTVQNFDENGIRTEVPIDVDIEVVFTGVGTEGAIQPLTATITGDSGSAVIDGSLVDGVGSFTIIDAVSDTEDETLTFEIDVEWPSADGDIDFAGGEYATNVEVLVSGTQQTT